MPLCVARPCIVFFAVLCIHTTPAYAQLSAGFTVDKTAGCSPLHVHFSDNSIGASARAVYQWSFGNGNESVQQNPEVVYEDTRVYTVTLTVTDGSQVSNSTRTISVYAPPSVNFSADQQIVCLSTPVNFTGTTAGGDGGTIGFLWDFGDGSTSSGSNLSPHVYQEAGTFTVSLTATNDYGCSDVAQKKNIIQVLPVPSATFSTDKSVLCLVSDPVQFTNNSTGPGTQTYLWDFGDGTGSTGTSPSHVYPAKGNYAVKLTVKSSNGCTAVATQSDSLHVANYQSYIAGPASGCMNTTMIFKDSSFPTPDKGVWQVDGVTALSNGPLTYTFSSAGTHTVTLTNTFGGCTQSLSKQVLVNALPNLTGFDAIPEGKCGPPATIDFTDHTPGATAWQWSFYYSPYALPPIINATTQKASNTYQDEGIYQVSLTVFNAAGCSSSVAQTLDVYPPIQGIYFTGTGPTSSCGNPVTQSFATISGTPLQSYRWDFGDGTTSTLPAPTHTFSKIGTYDILLYFTDQNGCPGVSNGLSVIISPPINIDFSTAATTVCGGTEVTFTSAPTDPYMIYYTWVYGDGTESYAASYYATHVYTTPGTYTVTLNLGDASGCNAVITKPQYITVLPSVTSSLSYANTCEGTRGDVTFTDLTQGATSMVWSFGDGTSQTTGNIARLTHTYTKTGIYPVQLTVTDQQCTSQTSTNVSVLLKRPPVLSADKASVCVDDTLSIEVSNEFHNPNLYLATAGGEYSVQFQYGDSTAFQGKITPGYELMDSAYYATLSPFAKGKKDLRVITTSGFGCSDTSNFIPLAIKGVAAGYEIILDDRCYQSPVILQDTSRAEGGNSIVSWLWDFGDGQTLAQGGTVSHTYATPGSYPVKLTVQDASGCSSSSWVALSDVSVNGPQAAFSPSGNNVPLNTTVSFTNTSNIYGSTPSWSWDFGDGTSSTGYEPAHTYTRPGTYTVTLTASDAPGSCTSTATQTIIVRNFNTGFRESLTYLSSLFCPPVLVRFTNTSVNYTSLSWNFGDGIIVTGVDNPSHVYDLPGRYVVTLDIYGPNGLTGEYIDSIVIGHPLATLTAAAPAFCVGQAGQLQAKSNGEYQYTWDFGDGSVSTTSDSSAVHVYTQSGSYIAGLVITDTSGCTVSGENDLTLQVHAPPVITITPAQPFVCLGSAVELKASGGATYSWSSTGSLSQGNTATPEVSPVVNTVYRVTAADDIGCQNSDSVSVTVIQPEKLTLTPDSAAICPGDSLLVKAGGTDQYSWIDNIVGLSDPNSPSPIARPVATTTYTVTGSDSYSCFTDTAIMILTVLPLPTVDAGADQEILAGRSVQLLARSGTDVVQWQWTPAGSLSCSNCADPVASPLQSTVYIVQVKNEAGCSSADTVVITLDCEQARVAIPNAFTPDGNGHNDRFVIQGIASIDHLVIYDRWGEKVFERDHFAASDLSACWDGTFNNRPAPTGVYVYFVQMQCPSGGVFTRKGTVVLVR